MEDNPIITVTLNPAVDLSASVDRFVPSHKLRCQDERRHPGGGGINVARLLTRLGARTVAIFLAGGGTGARLQQLLAQEKVPVSPVQIEGETRENVSITDRSSNSQYRFVLGGPAVSLERMEACFKAVLDLLQPGGWLVASGSLPPGLPDDTYQRLGQMVKNKGAYLALDTSGAPVQKALSSVHLLKVSETELANCAQAPTEDRDQCIAAARKLLAAGPRLIAVTRGNKGALLITDDHVMEARAPDVKAQTTIGAGDSFLAGLVWALHANRPLAQALAYAVAAGAAAVLQSGTALARPEDVQRLMPLVQVETRSPHALA